MSQLFHIHPENPQPRLIKHAVEIIQQGGVIIYPTDSAYALGCHIGDKTALERIRQIRKLDKNHHFTLMCRDLSEVATYARVDNNRIFRLLKANTPGAYTFILPATREVPRRLQHPKRKTIGLRIPDNVVAQALLTGLNEPLMSSTLIFKDESLPMADIDEVYNLLGKSVDCIVDGGACGFEPTTVVDFTNEEPKIIREGRGAPQPFMSF